MACCSVRRVTGRAWDGDQKPRGLLRELGGLVIITCLGVLGIGMITLLWPLSGWARRQHRRFVTTLTQAIRQRAKRVLDAPFLVGPARRCRMAASLYPLSRRLSGIVFRYFYLLLLGLVLVAIAGLAGVGVILAPEGFLR